MMLPEQQTFTLPWPPSANAAYRSIVVNGRTRVLLSKAGRAYKELAAWELLRQAVPSFGKQRVAVIVDVYPPDRRRHDLGNLDKLAIDALVPHVIDDDSQIDRLFWDRRNPVKGGRLRFTVTILEEPMTTKRTPARLITAAPDLLEALKEAANFIETEHFAIGWSLDRICEVIAKAESIEKEAI